MPAKTAVLALALATVPVLAHAGLFGGSDERVTFTMSQIDTADYVSLDVANKVNDSIGPFTAEFNIPQDASDIVIRLLRTTADTVFAKDSIVADFQTKFASNYDSAWFRVGASTKCAESVLNTAGGSARIFVPADSVRSFGEVGRLRFWIVVEEDTIRAHDQTGLIPLNASYQAEIKFKRK